LANMEIGARYDFARKWGAECCRVWIPTCCFQRWCGEVTHRFVALVLQHSDEGRHGGKKCTGYVTYFNDISFWTEADPGIP
jgi:hypothetical protein